ncbi:MAG: DUF3772 domain-containing protein [Marivita sp.]|uniref:DUF3772 domain-containing protein n=1 Tax=Marivita sp. TaxID=2003365 RepID=UPI003EF700BB
MRRILTALRVACVFLFLTAGSVWAQTGSVDYDVWNSVAQSAERVVASEITTTERLEDLRSEIAGFRDRLLLQQNAADPRLATLQAQLDALGAPPEDGSEPAEIAQRRVEIQEQITRLQAPLFRAEEAYSRADALITTIDETIRSRETERLLQRNANPLDPRLWGPAIAQMLVPFREIGDEFRAGWTDPDVRETFWEDLPVSLFLVALALGLVFRAPGLIDRLGIWLRAKTRRGTGVWSVLLGLLRVAVPVFGAFILFAAINVGDALSDRSQSILVALPMMVLVVLFSRWLATETFSSDDDVATVSLPQKHRTEARYYVNVLSWFLALNAFLTVLVEMDAWDSSVEAVVGFVIHVLCGLILFRLGQILRQAGPQNAGLAHEDEPANLAFASRLARVIGQAAMAVGVVGPLLSAVGYFNLAEAMIFPTITTFGLFALLLIVQRLIRDTYHLVTGTELDESQSLLPVVSGSLLMIGALPLLALIWGARVADLTELWARFQAGLSFGDTRISPTDFLTFAAVFMIGYVITRLLQGGLRGSVLPKTRLDKGGQTAIVSGIGYLGIFLSVIIAITAAGIDLTALAFVAGALSVGIGFGLQNIVQNFVSGIILLIERPISEGDWIEVNGQQGTVRDISVRSTRIETFDRTDVIVPNADLVSNSVTNYTRGNVLGRLIVDVGVAYGTDTRKVEEVLYKIARNHDMVLMNPEPFVLFRGFGADSLDFDVRMVLRDVTKILMVRNEVNHQIAEAFAREGIEIPFAQRDIWLRNPEALHRAPATPVPVSEPEEPTS